MWSSVWRTGPPLWDRLVRKVVRKRPERLDQLFGVTALAHRFDQLVIKRLVGEEHRARDLHSRLGGLDRARRGKQQILDDIDLVAEIEQAQTRLQDADVGLASRDDHLL